MDGEELIIQLPLENGCTIDCTVLAIFESGGREYIALLPEDEENNEILLYRYVVENEEEEEIRLESIEDEFEFERAVDVFDTLMEDVSEE